MPHSDSDCDASGRDVAVHGGAWPTVFYGGIVNQALHETKKVL
jgi:hypothetical protein